MTAVSRTALLVDDGATRQRRYRDLQAQGYDVVVVDSKDEALARLPGWSPNAIFVHLGTGGADNIALIQALRSNDASRHIPIVVLSDGPKIKAGGKELNAVRRDLW
jgi:CheY-like chemotaxis protein